MAIGETTSRLVLLSGELGLTKIDQKNSFSVNSVFYSDFPAT
jgi:hypothetical protein